MAYKNWNEILQYVITAVENGNDAQQIADYIGVRVKTMSRQLNRMKQRGIPNVPSLQIKKPHRPKGVKNKFTGRQKSDEQWVEIRNNVCRWLEENVSREVIAQKIGIQVGSLSNRLYRWRQEGYNVPWLQREKNPDSVRARLLLQKEENARKRALRALQPPVKRVYPRKEKVEKIRKERKRPEVVRLPNRIRDTSNMVYISVDSRTKIQIPADKDPEAAIAEWRKRYNKHK